MMVLFKKINAKVDVCCKECLGRECFWARPDPGIFVQGRGYRSREGKRGWICGRRAIHGCPEKYCNGEK